MLGSDTTRMKYFVASKGARSTERSTGEVITILDVRYCCIHILLERYTTNLEHRGPHQS